MPGEVRGLRRYLVVMALRYVLVCAVGAAGGTSAWLLLRLFG
jgi:hypothetical protein